MTMQVEPIFETGDALAAVSLDRKLWNNLMQRGQYEAAPAEPRAGHPRMFTVDDVVCLFVVSHYVALGAPMAARIATAVRAELDRAAAAGRPDPAKLWVIFTSDGTPHRVTAVPQSGPFVQVIDLAAARELILTHAEQKLGWTRPA